MLENVRYFSEKEEELITLLINLGFDLNVAKVLVYLTRAPEANSHAVERGANLRQNQVSVVMKYLNEQGWLQCREHRKESNGRPVKIYKLAKPVPEIIDMALENERKKEAPGQKVWIYVQSVIFLNFPPMIFFSNLLDYAPLLEIW